MDQKVPRLLLHFIHPQMVIICNLLFLAMAWCSQHGLMHLSLHKFHQEAMLVLRLFRGTPLSFLLVHQWDLRDASTDHYHILSLLLTRLLALECPSHGAPC